MTNVCVSVCNVCVAKLCRTNKVISQNEFYKLEFEIKTRPVDKILEEDPTSNISLTFLLLALLFIFLSAAPSSSSQQMNELGTSVDSQQLGPRCQHKHTDAAERVCVNMLFYI